MCTTVSMEQDSSWHWERVRTTRLHFNIVFNECTAKEHLWMIRIYERILRFICQELKLWLTHNSHVTTNRWHDIVLVVYKSAIITNLNSWTSYWNTCSVLSQVICSHCLMWMNWVKERKPDMKLWGAITWNLVVEWYQVNWKLKVFTNWGLSLVEIKISIRLLHVCPVAFLKVLGKNHIPVFSDSMHSCFLTDCCNLQNQAKV